MKLFNDMNITAKLEKGSSTFFILYVGGMALLTYISMYGFRKPFTVATYHYLTWAFSIDFKTCMLIANFIGYSLSKFIGIKVVSEMTPRKRVKTILGIILFAHMSLLLLPLLPQPYNLISLFLNGLPLGLVWGVVFSFLEGRRVTEAVGAILCASFVFGSGVVKTVGQWLMTTINVPELWMPFVAGCVFLIPLLIGVIGLSKTPPPTNEDIALRHQRIPMNHQQRKGFFLNYWLGIVLLVVVYTLLTTLRQITDSFAVEIWTELGFGNTPSIFTSTSVPVSILIVGLMFSLMGIKNNIKALLVNHIIIVTGILLFLIATLLNEYNLISGLAWFILVSTGLYAAYIPFNCILFDRLVACSSSLANAGFLIYLSDSFGNLASVNLFIFKSLAKHNVSWLHFTKSMCIYLGIICPILLLISIFYFNKKFDFSFSNSRHIRQELI